MEAFHIDRAGARHAGGAPDAFVAGALGAAARGEGDAYFELGIACSTGSNGFARDYVEAHKWFNLAAIAGHEPSALSRAEIAAEMTAREIAQAQRAARQWLATTLSRAA